MLSQHRIASSLDPLVQVRQPVEFCRCAAVSVGEGGGAGRRVAGPAGVGAVGAGVWVGLNLCVVAAGPFAGKLRSHWVLRRTPNLRTTMGHCGSGACPRRRQFGHCWTLQVFYLRLFNAGAFIGTCHRVLRVPLQNNHYPDRNDPPLGLIDAWAIHSYCLLHESEPVE